MMRTKEKARPPYPDSVVIAGGGAWMCGESLEATPRFSKPLGATAVVVEGRAALSPLGLQ